MDLEARRKTRQATGCSRQPPGVHAQFTAGFADGKLEDVESNASIELTIEATNAQGEFAVWLDDIWWTEAIRRWADTAVSVHLAPTQGALLHPVLLHQIEMLRRVVPTWRIVGHAYVADVYDEEGIRQTAVSPYHEIRFLDCPRPGVPQPSRCNWPLHVEELFARIRKEQQMRGLPTPVLVRLPSKQARSDVETSLTSQSQPDHSATPQPTNKMI